MHGRRSSHLAASLTSSPADEATVAAIRNELAHATSSREAAALIREAVAPLVDTPEWRNMLARVRTQILHNADPHQFPRCCRST